MKKAIFLKIALVLSVATMLLESCSSPRELVFANRQWHVSDFYGQIIDKDTTYRMTFGNVLIPDPLAIVSSADSVAKYPGMDRFLADILHTAHLDGAEILFYAPEQWTMFVKPKDNLSGIRPSSLTSPMSDEKTYTMWIYEDDQEEWTRKPDEMYTYTYVDKKNHRLVLVDSFDYGDTPIAQIFIIQATTRATDRMNVPYSIRYPFRKHMVHVEAVANGIEFRRALAISNYKIGQEQKLRMK